MSDPKFKIGDFYVHQMSAVLFAITDKEGIVVASFRNQSEAEAYARRADLAAFEAEHAAVFARIAAMNESMKKR